MQSRRVLRIVRFVLLAGIVLLFALVVRAHERYRIPPGDLSLDPTYPPGSQVVVRLVDEDDALARGADVVYAMEREGVRYARFGRVRGLPGDVVGVRDGFLTVNGEPLEPFRIPGEPMGEVPEDKVLILAVRPSGTPYPDSRKLGFIDRSAVRGVILFRLGWS